MSYDPNRPQTSYTGSGTERESDRSADRIRMVEDVRDRAYDVAGHLKDKAQQVGAQAADKADAAATTVGEKITDIAQTLREKAPMTGTVANVADTAAESLERAGTYLQQQEVADMRADLEQIIRRHPIESLLIGIGIGYLLARSTSRRPTQLLPGDVTTLPPLPTPPEPTPSETR